MVLVRMAAARFFGFAPDDTRTAGRLSLLSLWHHHFPPKRFLGTILTRAVVDARADQEKIPGDDGVAR